MSARCRSPWRRAPSISRSRGSASCSSSAPCCCGATCAGARRSLDKARRAPHLRAMADTSRETRVELIVVGGGLVGLTLGIACAEAGIEVAVVDREDPAAMLAEPFDGRTTAIAHGSQQVLNGIGFWPLVAAEAEPILEIRVADGGSPLFLHYDHNDIGDHPLGYIVENRVLRRALMARAAALPSLRQLAPLAVERVERALSGATAYLADGSILRGALVAACDGRNSPLRRAAGIKTLEWTYPQISIVCTVRHEKPHRGVAVEHFLPAGPFAILPMTENRSSIVWTERADLAPGLLALDAAAFAAELGRRFGDFLGALEVVGPRFSYALSLLHAERYVAPRLSSIRSPGKVSISASATWPRWPSWWSMRGASVWTSPTKACSSVTSAGGASTTSCWLPSPTASIGFSPTPSRR